MSISAGEKMPSGSFSVMGESGPEQVSTDDLFSGKKVVLVSVPGAFTPTCSKGHLPGYQTLFKNPYQKNYNHTLPNLKVQTDSGAQSNVGTN